MIQYNSYTFLGEICLTDTDETQLSTDDLASTEQTTVEQFCRASVSPAINCSSSAATSPMNTMFFKSPENSCCGSVTIKTELQELSPAVSGTCTDTALQGVERRQTFWNWDIPFETPSCDSSFTFNGHHSDDAVYPHQESKDVDVYPGFLPVYTSCRTDVLASSASSLGTVLTPSELPAPVRCLLTPPDSVPSSPETDESKMGPEEVASSPDEPHSPPENNGLLVLTPVTRRPRRTHPGCTTIKYNRKNNPELERRRVHFCDFPG